MHPVPDPPPVNEVCEYLGRIPTRFSVFILLSGIDRYCFEELHQANF